MFFTLPKVKNKGKEVNKCRSGYQNFFGSLFELANKFLLKLFYFVIIIIVTRRLTVSITMHVCVFPLKEKLFSPPGEPRHP
jgi:hypothetical protein